VGKQLLKIKLATGGTPLRTLRSKVKENTMKRPLQRGIVCNDRAEYNKLAKKFKKVKVKNKRLKLRKR
jgi:hypothetical protein